MKNNKGFVMTETLVVTVFLVTIFTFVYVSIIPLMGKYDDMTFRNSDIDIIYKLYNVRKMINNDNNKNTIIGNTFKEIKCQDLADQNYCNNMMVYLELSEYDSVQNRYYDRYILVYADNIHNRLTNFQNLSSDTKKELYEYIKKYEDVGGNVLVILDKTNHTIAHLTFH